MIAVNIQFNFFNYLKKKTVMRLIHGVSDTQKMIENEYGVENDTAG